MVLGAGGSRACKVQGEQGRGRSLTNASALLLPYFLDDQGINENPENETGWGKEEEV